MLNKLLEITKNEDGYVKYLTSGTFVDYQSDLFLSNNFILIFHYSDFILKYDYDTFTKDINYA